LSRPAIHSTKSGGAAALSSGNSDLDIKGQISNVTLCAEGMRPKVEMTEEKGESTR